MGKHLAISNKFLGGAIIVGLILQYVTPRIGLDSLSNLAILIYLFVAIYLLFIK